MAVKVVDGGGWPDFAMNIWKSLRNVYTFPANPVGVDLDTV